MDAHMPVTHEEGDRYPLGPPYKNTLHAHPSWLTAGSGASNQASHSVFLYGKVSQTMERQAPGNERPILVATEVQVLWSAPSFASVSKRKAHLSVSSNR